ncbi:MAG: dnaX [Chlamydiales bacterium]|jgi:DNA polymerase-3 subunit gamma/tau|nr:dnaX [Chlamydiales bacterium]
MTDYLVVARKFRPQCFSNVLGQDSIVKTLKNALKHDRLAQAYLFSGPRGSGKTTLARLLAKACNCLQLDADLEPCNNCPSCKEIMQGQSLDVIEIDGASNRGIEDIRRISETIGYAASSGKYKIYIIDEVHMLTKEAFNALLKTLEEPPPKAKFFFATTELHKVLPTILSRCQRFELSRIAPPIIVKKLQMISKELKVEIELEALELIATSAEGALRDAESLFDQIVAFSEGSIKAADVRTILGIPPREWFFRLDEAMDAGDLKVAFEIAGQVFAEGKDLNYFLDGLIEHIRLIAYIKVKGEQNKSLNLTFSHAEQYLSSARKYRQEQCLYLLESLLEAQQKFRFAPSKQIALEAILLQLIRSKHRLSVEVLVQRLIALENQLVAQGSVEKRQIPEVTNSVDKPAIQNKETEAKISVISEVEPSITGLQTEVVKDLLEQLHNKIETSNAPERMSTEQGDSQLPLEPTDKVEPQKIEPPAPPVNKKDFVQKQSHYDTLMQFAAVELEGTLKKGRKTI